MRWLFLEPLKPRIRYPRLLLVALTFVLAYFLFNDGMVAGLKDAIIPLGYAGTFLAGMMYSYGFTAAPGTAILLILAGTQNPFIAAAIGGLGSLVMDLILYQSFKIAFDKELKRLARGRLIRRILHLHKRSPGIVKRYLAPAAGAVVIASPLPDEIGISILAASGSIKMKWFSVACFVLNTAGMLAVLLIGTAF